MSKPYASVLNNRDHLTLLVQIIAERLDDVHLLASENRTMLVGQVDASALYFLAEQFDVLGYKGWFLADTEQKRRDLIRRAIELHRFKGTPWSLKEAIKTLGFTDVTLIERVGLITNYYDGETQYNGAHEYGGPAYGEWATFSVIIDLADWTEYIGTPYSTALLALIDEYKNVRSHLVDLIFQINFEDSMTMDEDWSADAIYTDTESLSFSIFYDGEVSYDGEYDYDPTGDSLTIIEIPFQPTVVYEVSADGTNYASILVAGSMVDIDWGDGSPTETVTDGYATHLYPTAGTYDVKFDAVGITALFFEATSFARVKNFTNLPDSLESIGSSAFDNTTCDLTFLNNLKVIDFRNTLSCVGIDVIVVPSVAPVEEFYINADSPNQNSVSTIGVNNLLIRTDETGVINGTWNSSNQNPAAPPTGDGITAKNNLLAKGWTVNTD